MSALAQAYLDKGCNVSGSDRLLEMGQETPTLATLRQEGVALHPQDGRAVSAGMVVVYSTAIEADNGDLVAAKRVGARLMHRSEALAELAEGHELIAVTGTCGKSTVTAFLGHLLKECGRNPFVVNGAEVIGWDCKGRRIGSVWPSQNRTGLMVVEADESDKSLMALTPTHVIVTNASSDHFPKAEAEALFRDFKAKASGIVIDTSDAPEETAVRTEGWETRFDWRGREWMLPMPGAHNVANAKAALEMALALGCGEAELAEALATFPGVRRRLERVGTLNGACVVDDYAHNVEKLRKMMEGLAEMFNTVVRPCDRLLLLPVYDAGGTTDRSVNSDALLARLTCPAESVADLDAAEARIRDLARPGMAVATFGARDPGLPVLARRLAGLL